MTGSSAFHHTVCTSLHPPPPPCPQEATPEGFLTANEVLLRLEGAAAAQTLALPGATAGAAAGGGSAAAGSNGSSDGGGGGGPLGLAAGLKSLAAGLRSFIPGAAGDEGAAGVGEGGAAMPQVHAVLLEQLDLVPSKGGIEAAGLRFMQLQVRSRIACVRRPDTTQPAPELCRWGADMRAFLAGQRLCVPSSCLCYALPHSPAPTHTHTQRPHPPTHTHTSTQRHAAKGDHTAALESIFSSDAGSAAPSAPAAPLPAGGVGAAAAAEGPTLSGHMEVVDAVLRLAADASSSNDALRCVFGRDAVGRLVVSVVP